MKEEVECLEVANCRCSWVHVRVPSRSTPMPSVGGRKGQRKKAPPCSEGGTTVEGKQSWHDCACMLCTAVPDGMMSINPSWQLRTPVHPNANGRAGRDFRQKSEKRKQNGEEHQNLSLQTLSAPQRLQTPIQPPNTFQFNMQSKNHDQEVEGSRNPTL